MLIGRHYQNAYVTRDLDAAMASVKARAEVRHESMFEGSTTLQTASGEAAMENRLAFLWIGDLQIELIQPVGGLVDFYRDVLPAGGGIAFHHICMRVDDWDGFRARVDRQPYPLVFEGKSGPLRFLYLDARRDFGHYLEYTNMPDAMWQGMGGR
jgi:hypothetical protein